MNALSSLQQISHELFLAAAEQAALLGAPARLKIMVLLAQSPRTVDSLAEKTGESVANISQHLKKLKEGGLLSVRKDGVSRIYELADERVGLLVEAILDIAELQSSDFQKALKNLANEDEWVDGFALDGAPFGSDPDVVLLDVRDADESAATPVVGALKIPHDQIRSRIVELDANKIYWVVCRGRTCAQATESVRLLRKKGLSAYRMQESPI